MTPGFWQILIIAVVVIIIFGGRGRITNILSDLGKGIRSFKQGLSEDDSSKTSLEDKSEDKPEDKSGKK